MSDAKAATAEAEQIPAGTRAQQQVEPPLRRKPAPESPERPERARARRNDADPSRDLLDRLPFLTGLAARLDDRLGPLHIRCQVERQERQREVLAFEERRC